MAVLRDTANEALLDTAGVELLDTVFASILADLPPNEILASTNLAGAVGDIDDSPASPDASWLTATSATDATILRVGFPTPGT